MFRINPKSESIHNIPQSQGVSLARRLDSVRENLNKIGSLGKNEERFNRSTSPDDSTPDSLRIAISSPELQQLQKSIKGDPANATHIIQGYIASGLLAHEHNLTFIMPRNLKEIVCTNDLRNPTLAPQTWSASPIFKIASKAAWRIQKKLGIPYLSIFSNFRLYDACLQCLPGHDLVYERNSLYRNGVAMACKKLRIPYILYFEADEILEYDIMGKPITGVLRWRAKELIRYNLKAADKIICVSNQGKSHLVNNWRIPAEKIVVFPNAVDLQRFRPNSEEGYVVRESLGVEHNPLILFVGRFYEWHDVTTLLDAIAKVVVTHPDAHLILVGDGSQQEAMVQYSIGLGINHKVRFTGLVPHTEVPSIMAAADIAVVPYPRMEHDLWLSPLKMFEYMASGTAVIASEMGQIRNVIKTGKNGLLVPPGDASALGAAIIKLIDNPKLRSQLGEQARQDMVKNYSWKHYILRLENLFNTVIADQHNDDK